MEGDRTRQRGQHPLRISIHALRMEGDLEDVDFATSLQKFLSTPSAWRATGFQIHSHCSILFLSTPSAWRATSAANCSIASINHFYPRPPHGGRLCFLAPLVHNKRDFYPRPPHGGRRADADSVPGAGAFLSTPSAWRATDEVALQPRSFVISIHALRMEGDISQ